MEKPNNINEYKTWLKENHDFEISEKTRRHYETVSTKVKQEFEKSLFWILLIKNLGEYNGDYLAKTGYHLLIPDFNPKLHIKSFESFLLKTYRKNIIDNKNWPEEPEGGWIFPNNWYNKINDIIRTLIIVKYLDGTEFMINRLESFCIANECHFNYYLEAREEGYFAAHVYTRQDFEIPKIDWDTEMVSVSIEIQITTQIQEVIRNLLHKYYEDKRKSIKKKDVKWQWDYKSDEFIANYLGNILHYLEGMIMEIREKQTDMSNWEKTDMSNWEKIE